MNFIRTFFTQRYRGVLGFSILSIGILGVISFAYPAVTNAQSSVERVVTIHDGDKEKKGIVTKATTVQEVLKNARINLLAYDSVDPELDTELRDKTYQINIYRAHPVMVIDGVKKLQVMTPFETPRQIAKAAKIPLYDEDITRIERSNDILRSDGAGMQLVIDRATVFTLVLYGKPIEARTQQTTIQTMLDDKRIKLGPNDSLSLPSNTPITSGMKVEIWRNGKQTITQEEPIAFATEKIQDETQPIGYKQVKTPGVLGKKMVTYEVDMRNGQELSRREIQSVQTLAPQKQVEIVGAKGSFSGSFGEALARLRSCEGSYSSNTGNGYYGAYQFDIGTWGGYGGYPNAAAAPPAVQDQKAWETYQRRGWQPWPSCKIKMGLQDIYR
jgi:uncharacterized protein YabE (DUF348 family)